MTRTELHAIIAELSEQKNEAEKRESVLQRENIALRSRLLQLAKDYQLLLDKIEGLEAPVAHSPLGAIVSKKVIC